MPKPLFLRDQSVLCLSGLDRKTFLQGLITNDITLMSSTSAIYSLLLTPQGRFLHDFFLIEHKDFLFIIVQKDQIDPLKKRLNLYKLRADVSINDVSSEYAVFASLGNSNADLPYADIVGHDNIKFQDPRLTDLGYRWIVKRQQIDIDFTQTSGDIEYNFFRLTLGIPQGYQDMIPERSIPLESGVQDLNAISWTKGCYIGQELMARTRYRGEIRKRLFPVEITAGNFKDSGYIINDLGNKVGELHSFHKNRGLARLKLEAIEHPLFLNNVLLTVHKPTWMNLTS